MINSKIDNISLDVKKFLSSSEELSQKINIIEDKMNKMQNYFLRPITSDYVDLEEHKAFNDFLRKGVASDLITKSLSGDDDGGVLLAPKLQKKIISSIIAKSPMRQLASVESISTRALDIIVENGDFGSGWVSETAEREVTDIAKLTKKTIHIHELYAQPKATQSIIDDSEINIENWLAERLSDSFTKLENEAFITGDGDNKPFGLLKNSEIEQIESGTGVSPNVILRLINRLPEDYLSNATLLMNRNTLSAFQGIKDETGRFIWQQSLSDPLKQTIFGVPVVISSNMPDIGAGNISIALGDFKSAYKIVDRSNIKIVRDPYTDKPYIKFYAVKRVGGDVVNPQAIKFAKFS